MERTLVFMYGPTAVGKTGLAELLAACLSAHIINCDAAQMYAPFSIGTAKPQWKTSSIKQHLFDVLDEPNGYNASWYATQARQCITEVTAESAISIIVGGSGFYLYSLFFPLQAETNNECIINNNRVLKAKEISWEHLALIDPARASRIHPSDTYRISRALALWKQTGKLPSEQVPCFNPPEADHLVVCLLDRDPEDLAALIAQRTDQMLTQGWIQEAQSLIHTPWRSFICEKKYIGYEELFAHIEGTISLVKARDIIIRKTIHYAKKQRAFGKMMAKKLRSAQKQGTKITVTEVNLTLFSSDLYINQLINTINTMNIAEYRE